LKLLEDFVPAVEVDDTFHDSGVIETAIFDSIFLFLFFCYV